MTGINKVIIAGTLGSDPQDLTTKDGQSYTSLSLAVNHFWKNKEGDREKKTDWHRITVFGKTAENCQSYLRKGSSVCVEGHLSNYQIEQDGKKIWKTSINADQVHFLSRKNEQAS